VRLTRAFTALRIYSPDNSRQVWYTRRPEQRALPIFVSKSQGGVPEQSVEPRVP